MRAGPRVRLPWLLCGLAALAASAAVPGWVSAQTGSGSPELDRHQLRAPALGDLSPGDRIEVWSPLLVDRRDRGTMRSLEDGELGLSTEAPDTVFRIPVDALERVRLVAGRRGAPFRGAFLGAAVGLATGIAYDDATGERTEGGAIIDPRYGLRVGVTLGGALAGALAGQLWKVDDWREVELP